MGERRRRGSFSAQDIAAGWGQDLGQNWAVGTHSGEERLDQEGGTGTAQSPGHLQAGFLS